MERANRDVEDILACWMRENDTTKWADGLRCVQWQKNNRLHSGIGRTPFNAMFGEHRYSDTNGNALPDEVWATLTTEEDLTVALGAEQEQIEQPEEEQ